jgi:hypothetical protein
MKKISLLFSLLFFMQLSKAQVIIKDSLNNGIGQIILGDSISKYDGLVTAIQVIGEGKTKAGVIYSYRPITENPLNIGGVDFRLAMLTFDTTQHLSFFSISRMYNPKNNKLMQGHGKEDYKKILAYLQTSFNDKGTEKILYDKKLWSLKGYEWIRNSTTINFNIQQDSRSNVTFISLDFKKK